MNILQDLLSIFSIIITVIVAIISLYFKEKETNQSYSLLNKAYVFNHRINTWTRQQCLLTVSVILLRKKILNYIHGKTIHDYHTWLFLTSLIISILVDGIKFLSSYKSKQIWFIAYIIQFSYVVISFMSNFNTSSLANLLFFSIGLAFTIFEILLPTCEPQLRKPTDEYTSNLFSYLSFSYITRILIIPYRSKTMEIEDVPTLVDDDSTTTCWEKFKIRQGKVSIYYNLFLIIRREWIIQGFFQLLGSTTIVIAPLALEIILAYVKSKGSSNPNDVIALPFDISLPTAVFMLFCGPALKAIGDNQNYARGRHVGIRVKSALISAVYKKSLAVDLTTLSEGVGKVNNLISVDVAAIQEFFAYSHFLWSTPYEIAICMTMLYLVLGSAAFSGLIVMTLFLVIGLIITKKLEDYQSELLENKDKRMGIVNEILNGIRIIKLFAWEDNFLNKLNSSRKHEISSLKKYLFTMATLKTVWEAAPISVACTAFMVQVYILKRPLTSPVGFASITLFNILRFPLLIFPEMINNVVTARVSMARITEYLNAEDVKGLDSNLSNKSNSNDIISINNTSLGWNVTKKELENSTKEFSFCNDITNNSRRFYDIMKRIFQYFYATKKYEKVVTTDRLDVFNQLTSQIEMNVTSSRDEVEDDEVSITINDNPVAIVLSKVHLSIPVGSLSVVVGPTGSGKSTLLSGILGECKQLNGSIEINLKQSIAYVTQSAWIQNATFRDNILFGNEYDHERYMKVLFACALLDDIKLLDAGDMTEIGEKGVNLSGGQQQRVSLGRAAYSKNNIIIMDDPLSAVDAHVGSHIFQHLICGFLSDRTRILVTHQVAIAAPVADLLICLDNQGNVCMACPPNQLKSSLINLRSQPEQISQKSNKIAKSNSFTDIYSFIENIITITDNYQTISNNNVSNLQNNKIESKVNLMSEQKKYESINSKIGNIIVNDKNSMINKTMKSKDSSNSKAGKLIDKEKKQVGEVPFKIYWFYAKACGGILATIVMSLCCVVIAVSWVLENYSLGLWINNLRSGNEYNRMKSLSVYIFFTITVLLSTLVRSFLEAIFSLRGAQKIHDNMTRKVVLANISWFDTTPLGRIVNRFSQDISTVDKDIMNNLSEFIDCSLGTIQIVSVIAWTIPLLLIPLIPILMFTSWITYQYLQLSRDLKRLESISKSPVFVLFSETVQGLPIIRAFRQQERFYLTCAERVDNMNRCHLYLWLCNRWLNFRMQNLGALVAGIVGLGVVYSAGSIDNTTAGLALIYSLTFTENLTFLARTHANVQMNLNSVERIQEYTIVASEKYHLKDQSNQPVDVINDIPSTVVPINTGVPSNWPSQGTVEFVGINVKYASSPSYILNNVNFKVPHGKKIGIVGRTGAGKSTLISSLFRTVEPETGSIIIDGVNVLNIPLYTLRSKIAIVPQEPILFQGSVRSNLDPFTSSSDEDLWKVLRSVHLSEYVASMPGGTNQEFGSLEDKLIAEKGGNLSVGQRQLLCMARALLRKAPILVLDECTANVDHETDSLIQDTVRNELKNITVLCIAHRLHTIAYYDMVLVMDKGSVAEYDSPLKLMQNEKSIFYSMCLNSGDFDNLYNIAKAASVENN